MALSHSTLEKSSRPLLGTTYADRRRLFLFAFGVPAVVYVLVIAIWPLAQGMWYSLTDYSLTHPASGGFIGFDNYTDLWADDSARRALINTFAFTVCAVALEFLCGFGLALLLWRDGPFNRACLAFLLIPVTITPLVVGLIFRALLSVDYGLVGYYLADWGITGPRGLLAYPATALATLVVIDVWEWTPLMAMILLAGLKALPGDVLEAARADGATPLQRLRLIVLPLMLPAIFLALVLRMMDAFRVFDSVFVTTGGGPADATNTLMLYGVKQGLQFFNIGFASAIANVTMLCIAIMAAAFMLLIRGADRRTNER